MDIETTARQIYDTLTTDGLAVVPTAAGYGILAMGRSGVERIYALKGRPTSKPCVTVTTWPIFDQVTCEVDPDTRGFIRQTLSYAPLAVIARVRPDAPLLTRLDPIVLSQCTQAGTIATFHGAGTLVTRVAELAFADGRLVVGSSGNRSGAGNAYALDEVPARLEAELVVDVGTIPMPGGVRLATTILDLATGRFLREGVQFPRIAREWAAHPASRNGQHDQLGQ